MVNIDSVYQTVQALVNKEQRGYLTPQEFNLFANQAQQDIFEQYFYDLNALREKRGEGHEVGDSVQVLKDKIAGTDGVTYLNSANVPNGTTLPAGRIGRIFVDLAGVRRTLRLVNADEIIRLRASKWHKAGFDEAVYFENGHKQIQVWSGTGQIQTGVTCEQTQGMPGVAYWGYIIVNEKTTYDPTTSRHFSLPREEQPDLVTNILKLAGISIEEPGVYQVGAQEEKLNIQQENK